jgi:hypothetical protein
MNRLRLPTGKLVSYEQQADDPLAYGNVEVDPWILRDGAV